MNEKYLTIDVHNHYHPKETAQLAIKADGTNFQAILKGRPKFLDSRTHDIELRLKLMDEAGVDMVVLNQTPWSPQGLEMCKTINNGIAKVAQEHSDRFIPCCHIPIENGAEVLDELNRGINELGLKGLALISSTNSATLDSETLFPIYERVSEYDVPIVIHPTIRPGLWGGNKYGMEHHISREYDVAKATIEVLYGVLPRFPELKFIMPHHGGGMPSLKGRVMAHFEPEGWDIPHALKGLPKTPRELQELGLDHVFEEIFGKLYFDTAGFGGWMPITEAGVKTIRPDRLCFGTDYPFEIHDAKDVKSFIDDIKALDNSEQDKRNILGENVKRLFKV